MKAFIAVLLVAAVSGQMTTVGNQNILDLLRTRQMYPRVGVEGQVQGIPTLYKNFINQQTLNGGVYGDLTTTGQFLPSTQQFNIPSDYTTTNTFTTLYTLSQLYTLPIFQEYLTLPLFRQYLNVPAFQQYLVSQYFQQYFTQTTFRQFFVEPALFYKFIFPVVIQYQQQVGVTGYGYGYQQLVVPEIYVKYVPEIYRGLIPQVTRDVVVVGGVVIPTIYNINTNTFTYGKSVLPNIFNYYGNTQFGYGYKNVLPQVYNYNTDLYNTNTYGLNGLTGLTGLNGYNTINTINTEKVLFPQVYGYGKNMINKNVNYNMYNKNIFDVLTGKTVQVLGDKVIPFGYPTIRNTVPFTYNTNTYTNMNMNTQVPMTNEIVLEKIFKDLVEGKINIDDLKVNTEGQLLNNFEKVNKIVDPITGDYKIVEEKIVKPVVDTVVEQGELNKEALLNKVILKKQIFNKL